MEGATATKKLFHAIVVLGMTSSLGCFASPAPEPDASADGSNGKDSAVADAGNNNDTGNGSDAFTGWLGC